MGKILKGVDTFIYLGNILSRLNTLEDEVSNQLSKACETWKSWVKTLAAIYHKVTTKVEIYRSCVLTILLYGCILSTSTSIACVLSWEFNGKLICLLANMMSIWSIIMKHWLRWFGHLVCLEDTCMPKQVLYGELVQGKYHCCMPWKWYKGYLRHTKKFNIATNTWEYLASDRCCRI